MGRLIQPFPARGLTFIFQLVCAGGQFIILVLLLALLFTRALHSACVFSSCPHRGHVYHHGSVPWGWKVSLPHQHPLPFSVPSHVDMVFLEGGWMLGSCGLCGTNCLKSGTAVFIQIVNKMGPRSALWGTPPSRQVPPG